MNFNIKAYTPILDDKVFNYDYTALDDWYDGGKSYTLTTKFITGAEDFTPVIMDNLRANVGNCGPTAAYNIIKYYDKIGKGTLSNITQSRAYALLLEKMGKEVGTDIYQMASGIKGFVEERTDYTQDYMHYVPPLWGYFKGDLDKNYPILYTVGGASYHAVSTFGYMTLKENTGFIKKSMNFLIVASGWTHSLDYTNFDAVSWKLGCVMKIK